MDIRTINLATTPIQRDVVIVEGSDARSYLQSQLTQDIESLPLGGSAWSFILDPKSSIEAFVRATRIGSERVVLDVDAGFGSVVRERIGGLMFRTDARFSQDTWPGLAWRGPGANKQVIDAPVVADPQWSGIEGLDMVGPGLEIPADAVVRSAEDFERLRISAGWPAMGYELGPGIQPAMTGLVDVTVSFEKGCYTGQELVARTYHRGAAPTKRLVGLRADGVLSRGSRLTLDDADVGEVTSVAHLTDPDSAFIGLGYLARKVETPATVVSDGISVRTTSISKADA